MRSKTLVLTGYSTLILIALSGCVTPGEYNRVLGDVSTARDSLAVLHRESLQLQEFVGNLKSDNALLLSSLESQSKSLETLGSVVSELRSDYAAALLVRNSNREDTLRDLVSFEMGGRVRKASQRDLEPVVSALASERAAMEALSTNLLLYLSSDTQAYVELGPSYVDVMSHGISFRDGKSDIGPRAKEWLGKFAGFLLSDTSIQINVLGHTASRDRLIPGRTISQLYELAADRAVAVAAYLDSVGIGTDRLMATARADADFRSRTASIRLTPANLSSQSAEAVSGFFSRQVFEDSVYLSTVPDNAQLFFASNHVWNSLKTLSRDQIKAIIRSDPNAYLKLGLKDYGRSSRAKRVVRSANGVIIVICGEEVQTAAFRPANFQQIIPIVHLREERCHD